MRGLKQTLTGLTVYSLTDDLSFYKFPTFEGLIRNTLSTFEILFACN